MPATLIVITCFCAFHATTAIDIPLEGESLLRYYTSQSQTVPPDMQEGLRGIQ